MPKRKFNQITTTTTKKFVPRKKRKVVKRRPRMPIPRGPFPTHKIVKLRYMSNQQDMTCTSGAIATTNVTANQPVYLGNYPFGWNEWSALYNHYVVLGSKITVYQFGADSGTGTKINGFMGVYLGDDATNYTDYTTLVESRRGRFARITSDSSKNKLTQYFSAKKFFNVKDVKDNWARLGAGVAGAPQELANFKVWAQPANKTTTQIYYCNFLIEYIIAFSEPKDIPAS